MEYQILSNEFDVLVVGADPVGLWVACERALAKVNVRPDGYLANVRPTEGAHNAERASEIAA